MAATKEPDVVVWTNRGCGACVQAKRLLDQKQVTYRERRLKPEPAIQQAFAKATNGARTVPQIVVGQHHVGGFDDLVNIERSGELDVLLGRAQAVECVSFWARFRGWLRSKKA